MAATDAELDFPYNVAVDSDGNVYIADQDNHRIRKVDVSADPPTIDTIAGSGSDSSGSFSGDGGPATSARLNRPRGVAVASDGTVYIADWSNRRIRAVATDGTISTVAGTGSGSFIPGAPDGSPATLVDVPSPHNIVVSSTGAVYISASSSLVSVLTTNGPPRARDTSPTTPTGTPVSINVPVSDPNNDMVTVMVTTPPSNGTTTVTDTTIHYTPNTGFTGVDTFEYTVSDGQGGSTTATVRVGVGVGAPPPPPPPPPPPVRTRVITRTVEVEVYPTGPTRVRASADGPTRIDLRWTGPRQLYGEAVSSYEIEVSADQNIWTTLEPYLEGTAYTHTNLLASTTYYYRVYAHNAEGRSLASEVSSATTDDPPALTGFLDVPQPNSFQSGVGVLHGWVCEADEVIFQINGTPHRAAYGTERTDTQDACGDMDNSFGLLFNWNKLDDGTHEVVVLVDGTELGRATVTVTTLGEPFRTGLSGTCEAPDFPSTGESVTLAWQEAKQNFVLTDGSAPPTGSSAVASDVTGFLENPASNSFQSGIGVLSGWVCDAEDITLEINGQTVETSYGTERSDTESACGDTDNGFGVVFNWSELDDGDYEVLARADGVAFDRATVRVTTLGTAFLEDVTGTCEATDFPETGEMVTLTWQQSQQNFVITDVQ